MARHVWRTRPDWNSGGRSDALQEEMRRQWQARRASTSRDAIPHYGTDGEDGPVEAGDDSGQEDACQQ
jgi:hypothetical protein